MKTAIIILIIIIVLIGVIIFLHCQNNIIDLTNYELKSEEIVNSITIAHLSDLHSKPFEKVLDKLRIINPNIICITGDYVNDHCRNKEKMLEYGKKLLKIAPVFYITGNHERRLENFEELMNELKGVGFVVLLDEITTCSVNGNTVQILGLDENQADFEDYKARKNGTFVYKDSSKLFIELANMHGYKIVLSHFPENFEMVNENNYKQFDFDLQLSGHAHGGQFILPFIGPVFSPGQGLLPKYARGSFGDRPKLIVSRGLGNAEFPFRLFNHPEINIIKICKRL